MNKMYCYLPSVPLIPAAGVNDTGGQFATGVVDTGAVVHLYLRISPRTFEKIRNGPNGILWGWGETDS
jgi:hypothetical protein